MSKEFVGVAGNRSESDNGLYVAFVQRALRNPRTFRSFKRNRAYRKVLEHVTREQGSQYLAIIREQAPELLRDFTAYRANDQVGNPLTYPYPGVGECSPTTLRYVKVASDLKQLFKGDIGGRVAEIGVGYGGQMLVLDHAFALSEYHLFDLLPVLRLTEKYLESHILNSCYRPRTLNQAPGNEAYDLAISNYAFSELPSALQRQYVRKVLSRAARGYLTMNSGRPGCAFENDKLSLDELRALLPPFEVLEERPSTFRQNYLIVWGHR